MWPSAHQVLWSLNVLSLGVPLTIFLIKCQYLLLETVLFAECCMFSFNINHLYFPAKQYIQPHVKPVILGKLNSSRIENGQGNLQIWGSLVES